jgi:hypothetical protein
MCVRRHCRERWRRGVGQAGAPVGGSGMVLGLSIQRREGASSARAKHKPKQHGRGNGGARGRTAKVPTVSVFSIVREKGMPWEGERGRCAETATYVERVIAREAGGFVVAC